jgi:5-methylcytosine-specific restriction protein A
LSFNPGLKVGEVIDNQRLVGIFKCSPQGGMRRSKTTGTLVIVSNHIKSIYDDRWIGETFHYTGMGMTGDQSLQFAQNKTLAKSATNGVDVYLFEVFVDKEYTYMGKVALAVQPYTEDQPDQNGIPRKVWMFPLKLVGKSILSIPDNLLNESRAKKETQAKTLSDNELKNRAEHSPKKAGNRPVTSNQYDRNPWVTEYAKRRAKGKCQLCEQEAPFKSKKGEPFLETHHIIWLAEDGEDTINNTVALCPNCHRKMHSLNLNKDKGKLLQIAQG